MIVSRPPRIVGLVSDQIEPSSGKVVRFLMDIRLVGPFSLSPSLFVSQSVMNSHSRILGGNTGLDKEIYE